jgi:hypothetical protein
MRCSQKPGKVGSAFLPTEFAKWWVNEKAVSLSLPGLYVMLSVHNIDVKPAPGLPK